MQRLIPNKTKVRIELFRGVTVGDLIVVGVALALLIFVITSNLPWKWGICIIIAGLTGLLLARLDEQPNYIYLLHILSFFGLRRKFERVYSDADLMKATEEGMKQTMMGELFKEGEEAEEAKEDTSDKALSEDLDALQAEEEPKKKKEKKKSKKRSEKTAEETEEERQQRLIEKDRKVQRDPMDEIIPFTAIKDRYIEYLRGKYYGAVLEIDPVEFRFFSENRRRNSIENSLGRIIRNLHPNYSANIVKLERPIQYESYLKKEYDKLEQLSESFENGMLSEDELKARVEIQYDRINELRAYCSGNHIVTPFYYLVLFESDKRQLELQIRDAEQTLKTGELSVHRLDDKQLAVFLKYTNQIDFDEHDVDKVRPEDLHIWAQPDVVDIRPRRCEINHIITHNFKVVNYPTIVGDAWLAGLMSMPGVKVVFKFRPMERAKAIRNIDHSLTELRGQWSATGIDSRRMEIETHITTLQELLATLQNESESLLECNIYITAYDIMATRDNDKIPQPKSSDLPQMTEMKKTVRRSWQESGFRLNNMEFEQVQAFIASQVSALDPNAKDGRGISSNTVAACFPWIYAHISDEGGIKLGESDGIPVFIDFFRRDTERVNSNMVIVGKSGSGKSYATKSLLANLAAEDAKIFILDPENEYQELANNLHGQVINVGNAMYGRLNPFHIITALDDDEAGEGAPSGSYATHLQFLEEFFKQIMPDCEKDAMEYLNTLVDHMYLTHNITAETDLSKLTPEDYPIFDDLYDEVLQEFQSSDNVFTRDLLRSLMNYIAKFSTGGRNANIWNGPSTVTTDENFTVFNFQSMLANRNSTIANAQMLLVLKYIDNEIIKNRDYNLRYKTNRKIVVVIDEAHVFIDTKFPIALDFMFQLAKRIRKYNGMQIVITQNIKDFVGSEELSRKSTAIINACQYSFIFALAPNDIQDLVKLYENAGGINENEQEQIVQAPRGQAFTIMSPTSRSTFTVATSSGITEMFEQSDYHSRYFEGERGDKNWEDFVGVSREAHEKSMKVQRTQDKVAEAEKASSGGVVLRVFEEDEYEAYKEETKAKDREQENKVTLKVMDEPVAQVTPKEKVEEPGARLPISENLGSMASSPLNGAAEGQMAVFSMIANALGRMADAAERGGSDTTAPLSSEVNGFVESPVVPVKAERTEEEMAAEDAVNAALKSKEREIERLRNAMDEEIRRLREENEKLKAASQKQEDDGYDLFNPVEEEDEFGGESDGDLSVMFDMPDEDVNRKLDELDDFLDDDESYNEDDSAVVGDYEDEESYEDDESEEDEYSEDDEDEDEDYDEDEDEDSDEDEDYDEDEDEDEDYEDEDEDEDDDDDDFMASFCSFAESLMKMTPFERMRVDGKEVAVISLQELMKEAEAQRERRRKI